MGYERDPGATGCQVGPVDPLLAPNQSHRIFCSIRAHWVLGQQQQPYDNNVKLGSSQIK